MVCENMTCHDCRLHLCWRSQVGWQHGNGPRAASANSQYRYDLSKWWILYSAYRQVASWYVQRFSRILSSRSFFTAGGQSHIDIPNRQTGNCSVPGINQYGFDEYVGMSEGTHSMRYITHQKHNTYATGARYLYRNDVPLPPPAVDQILTDRQTDEAMRVVREQAGQGRPFFLNLWFDAPHR